MNTTYTQKNDTVQKVANANAESVKDSSIQNDSLQRKADMANGTAQRAADPRPNNTGLPDVLKTGIESLSGFSMDDVRVHYNSSKPASVQALAYTQGTDIHVAPGQEQHLPHEAWHVAQQMAGRVAPTTNINGMPVNDNAGLEHEADVMGERALQRKVGAVQFASRQSRNRANRSQIRDRHHIPNPFFDLGGWYRSLIIGRIPDLFKTEKGLSGHWNQVCQEINRLMPVFSLLEPEAQEDAREYLYDIKKLVFKYAKRTRFAFKIFVPLLNGQVFSLERKSENSPLIVHGLTK